MDLYAKVKKISEPQSVRQTCTLHVLWYKENPEEADDPDDVPVLLIDAIPLGVNSSELVTEEMIDAALADREPEVVQMMAPSKPKLQPAVRARMHKVRPAPGLAKRQAAQQKGR